MKSIGFDDYFVVEAEGFSGGIWIMWAKQWGSVEILSSRRQLVHLRVTPRDGLPCFQASFVYGSPNISLRDFLWRELRRITAQITEPWWCWEILILISMSLINVEVDHLIY